MIDIGFLGLGTMGLPMARNISEAGFRVAAWNRNGARAERLREVAPGVTVCATAADAVAGAALVVTMLTDDAALDDVLFGQPGAADALAAGSTVLDMSTTSPDMMRTLSRKLRDRGARLVDAPVFGSKDEAEAGTLRAAVGGAEEDVLFCRPALDVMCETVRHVGAVGMGSTMKLCGNAVILGMLNLLAESLALGEAEGLAMSENLAALADVADVWCPLFAGKGKQIVEGDFAVRFALRHAAKDLGLVAALGGPRARSFALAEAVRKNFESADAQGLGDSDCAAIVERYR